MASRAVVATCFSDQALQVGRARQSNRRRRSDLIQRTHKSMNRDATAGRRTRPPLAQAVQPSARQDQSGRGSTSCCDRTRRRLPYHQLTIPAGRPIPTRRRRWTAVQLRSRLRRVRRDRASCHSTACWDDPTPARSASGRPATIGAKRRNHVRQPAPVLARALADGDRRQRWC